MPTLSNFTLTEMFASLERTASANGTGIDIRSSINAGGRQMKAHLSVGGVSGTNPTLDVKIQESDASGSGYTDISDATFTQAVDDTREEKHFKTIKRYVRAVGTIGGTNTPTFDYGVLLMTENRVT